jgi:MYXO-CTERM domain-containing protein
MPRLLLLVVALALAFPAGASAGPIVDQAAQALASNPVYVHPDAERTLSPEDADRLRARIASSGAGPLYVAILPAAARNEAGGDATEVIPQLARALDRRGTYAVVVGGQFRAGSNVLERGQAARVATGAFEEHGDEGLAATLLAFADGVAAARRGETGSSEEESSGSDSFVPILIAVGAGGLGFVLLRRRRRARQEREALTTGKTVAQEDLLALADDIRALDLDVEMPDVDRDAKEHYGRSVEAYDRADRAYDRARRPADLAAVSSALEEGRYEMASAKARLEGRDAPERRPPCFFDPRHGPSERNVLWAPPGGELREVPACAADALRIEEGDEPEQREVLVGGRRTPYYGVPGLMPYASGFYGMFGGGLFPGFLLGSVFGGGLFAGEAHADTGGGDHGGGDAGGGDWGGGWGGGDFGGGGGGDFGGGGGGDF